MEPIPRNMSTCSFLVNSFGPELLKNVISLPASPFPFGGLSGGGVAGTGGGVVEAVALVIGISHVDHLTDSGDICFSFAQKAKTTTAQVGQYPFLRHFYFQFVGCQFPFG